MNRRAIPVLVFIALFGLSACTDSGYRGNQAPVLDIEHGGTTIHQGDEIRVTIPALPAGEEAMVTRVALRNLGDGLLRILEVRIEGDASSVLRASLVEPDEDGTLSVAPGAANGW
ncbi:MAG: hypothetical protein QF464_19120, partial [Myxococcota bacterium]|nr:hypothetical protein [Myxococcota bacterium]